ncbi:MAG TPA: hypothetical protein VFW25_00810 [Silvibacterium sp.]|nr:hypothetical protein [Silvibacterium sp.]
MIDRCFNPACGKEMRYLREGRVVRVIDPEIEHYWLCGKCHESYDFVFDSNGNVTLGTRFQSFIHEDDQRRSAREVAA